MPQITRSELNEAQAIKPFCINPCDRGYEVIASDTGRPMCVRPSAQAANGIAQRLNVAAATGDKRYFSETLMRLR